MQYDWIIQIRLVAFLIKFMHNLIEEIFPPLHFYLKIRLWLWIFAALLMTPNVRIDKCDVHFWAFSFLLRVITFNISHIQNLTCPQNHTGAHTNMQAT